MSPGLPRSNYVTVKQGMANFERAVEEVRYHPLEPVHPIDINKIKSIFDGKLHGVQFIKAIDLLCFKNMPIEIQVYTMIPINYE